jgi:cobalt/nickel transport system ATP-binding protein
MLHLNGILGENSPIQIANLDLNKDNIQLIRALVGLVFQNPDDQLFSPTVFEDVAFGPLHMGLPEADVYQRVEKALKDVQMSDFGDRLSHHLSMGQKKRIAIATVLAMEPHILILDEPTAGLDPRSRRALINFLRDLPITMLVSTHDLFMVADLFPRMLIMDEGVIVADGYSVDLLQDEKLLETHGLESPYWELST